MAFASEHAGGHWHNSRNWVTYHSRITTVRLKTIAQLRHFGKELTSWLCRWLLDTDQDAEGMRVIADLYGAGDPNNKHAKREFREIKETVLADVGVRRAF